MKKFIVGKFNYLGGDLIVDQVEADTDFDALKQFLIKQCETEADKEKQEIDNQYFNSTNHLIITMSDADIVMTVKEV